LADPHNDTTAVGGYYLYYWQHSWDKPIRLNIGKQTTYTLTGLQDGQTYYMAVTAHDRSGDSESEFSNVVTVTSAALENDAAPDSDARTVASVTPAANGTVALDGTAVTDASKANFHGTDTFTYTVSDEHGSIAIGDTEKVVFAVNAGGPAYVDAAGTLYEADTQFSGGSTYHRTAPIAGTDDDVLYQSERFGDFAYNVPLPNGSYVVTLHFAELYWQKAGRRVFDVEIEGTEVVSNLDLVATVGANVAHEVAIPVRVTDEELNIRFYADRDNAKVSAIRIEVGGETP
jgi:hypothetical protein